MHFSYTYALALGAFRYRPDGWSSGYSPVGFVDGWVGASYSDAVAFAQSADGSDSGCSALAERLADADALPQSLGGSIGLGREQWRYFGCSFPCDARVGIGLLGRFRMDDSLCCIGSNAYPFGGAVYQFQGARKRNVAYCGYDDWFGSWGIGECAAELCRPRFAQALYHMDLRFTCRSGVDGDAMVGSTLSCGYRTCRIAH